MATGSDVVMFTQATEEVGERRKNTEKMDKLGKSVAVRDGGSTI